jgi:hypothetical protein
MKMPLVAPVKHSSNHVANLQHIAGIRSHFALIKLIEWLIISGSAITRNSPESSLCEGSSVDLRITSNRRFPLIGLGGAIHLPTIPQCLAGTA